MIVEAFRSFFINFGTIGQPIVAFFESNIYEILQISALVLFVWVLKIIFGGRDNNVSL